MYSNLLNNRWIYEHKQLFAGKHVLGIGLSYFYFHSVFAELGSGVGLPGILSAYFAEEVVLTDYVSPVSLANEKSYNPDSRLLF